MDNKERTCGSEQPWLHCFHLKAPQIYVQISICQPECRPSFCKHSKAHWQIPRNPMLAQRVEKWKMQKNWSLQKPQNGLSRIFFCKGHRLGLGLRYRPDVVIPSYPAMFPSNKAWQGTKNVPINKLFNTSTAMLLVLRNLVVINCIHIMVVTAHVVEQRIPIKNVFIVNM